MTVLGKPLNRVPVVFVKDCGYIPSVLCNAEGYIDKYIDTKDLFQVQGCPNKVANLLFQLSSPKGFSKLTNVDVHDVTEAVKTFLVGLPEPLLSDDVCDQMIEASQTNNNLGTILVDVRQARPSHFAILHFMMRLLAKVADPANRNGMNIRKLATIFVLDVLKPLRIDDDSNEPVSFPSDRMKRLPYLIMVIEHLMEHLTLFKPVTSSPSPSPAKGKGFSMSPCSLQNNRATSRNSDRGTSKAPNGNSHKPAQNSGDGAKVPASHSASKQAVKSSNNTTNPAERALDFCTKGLLGLCDQPPVTAVPSSCVDPPNIVSNPYSKYNPNPNLNRISKKNTDSGIKKGNRSSKPVISRSSGTGLRFAGGKPKPEPRPEQPPKPASESRNGVATRYQFSSKTDTAPKNGGSGGQRSRHVLGLQSGVCPSTSMMSLSNASCCSSPIVNSEIRDLMRDIVDLAKQSQLIDNESQEHKTIDNEAKFSKQETESNVVTNFRKHGQNSRKRRVSAPSMQASKEDNLIPIEGLAIPPNSTQNRNSQFSFTRKKLSERSSNNKHNLTKFKSLKKVEGKNRWMGNQPVSKTSYTSLAKSARSISPGCNLSHGYNLSTGKKSKKSKKKDQTAGSRRQSVSDLTDFNTFQPGEEMGPWANAGPPSDNTMDISVLNKTIQDPRVLQVSPNSRPDEIEVRNSDHVIDNVVELKGFPAQTGNAVYDRNLQKLLKRREGEVKTVLLSSDLMQSSNAGIQEEELSQTSKDTTKSGKKSEASCLVQENNAEISAYSQGWPPDWQMSLDVVRPLSRLTTPSPPPRLEISPTWILNISRPNSPGEIEDTHNTPEPPMSACFIAKDSSPAPSIKNASLTSMSQTEQRSHRLQRCSSQSEVEARESTRNPDTLVKEGSSSINLHLPISPKIQTGPPLRKSTSPDPQRTSSILDLEDFGEMMTGMPEEEMTILHPAALSLMVKPVHLSDEKSQTFREYREEMKRQKNVNNLYRKIGNGSVLSRQTQHLIDSILIIVFLSIAGYVVFESIRITRNPR